jgi:uncharacterized protein YaiE (UPF0345 family)
MAITINGTGSITGLTTGGLPDGSITTDDLAANAVTAAKLSTGAPSWTSGGVLSFNSGYGSVATAYGCRAWVNFDGTSGSIGTGRASGNCSSITDNATGDYTFNFSTAMPDSNYAVAGSVVGSVTDSTNAVINAGQNAANALHSTSSFRFQTVHFSGNLYDYTQVQIIVFR